MGLICCKEEAPLFVDTSLSISRYKEEQSFLTEPLNLIELMGREWVEECFDAIEKDFNKAEFREKKNHITSQNLVTFNNKFDLWLKLTEIPESSNKLHNYYIEIDIPFTPELIQMFYLNMTEELFKNYNKNADVFEFLNYTIDENTIVYIEKTITKKMLVVKPKQFLLVRCVRRLPNGDMIEFSKSVKRTKLKNIKEMKEILEGFDNEGENVFSGILSRRTDKGTKQMIINRIDILSGIGLIILKSFIKKALIRSNNQLMVKLAEFTLNTSENDDLIWFTDDKEEILRVLEENRKLIDNSKLNLNELNAEAKLNYQISQSNISSLSRTSNIKIAEFLLSNLPTIKEEIKNYFIEKLGDLITDLKQRLSKIRETIKEKVKIIELNEVENEMVVVHKETETTAFSLIDEMSKGDTLENLLNSQLLMLYTRIGGKLDIIGGEYLPEEKIKEEKDFKIKSEGEQISGDGNDIQQHHSEIKESKTDIIDKIDKEVMNTQLSKEEKLEEPIKEDELIKQEEQKPIDNKTIEENTVNSEENK